MIDGVKELETQSTGWLPACNGDCRGNVMAIAMSTVQHSQHGQPVRSINVKTSTRMLQLLQPCCCRREINDTANCTDMVCMSSVKTLSRCVAMAPTPTYQSLPRALLSWLRSFLIDSVNCKEEISMRIDFNQLSARTLLYISHR